MEWIRIKDKAPEEGKLLVYYFAPLGCFIGKYKRCKTPQDGIHTFYGKSGFLTDDVTHWMPIPPFPKEDE
jgi:hypothetical protein